MESYIDLKKRARRFEDLSATVNTLEKIAASNIRRLKQESRNLDRFIRSLRELLARLRTYYDEADHDLLQPNPNGNACVLVITSNRGLVGKLWNRVIQHLIDEDYSYDVHAVVGTRGRRFLEDRGRDVDRFYSPEEKPSFDRLIDDICEELVQDFRDGTLRRIDVVYARTHSLGNQVPVTTTFLPFEMPDANGEETADSSKRPSGYPIFEPSKEQIYRNLIQHYVDGFFRQVFLDSRLSERTARVVSMERASEETEQLVDQYDLEYRKQRRKIITQRQTESFSAHRVASRETSNDQ